MNVRRWRFILSLAWVLAVTPSCSSIRDLPCPLEPGNEPVQAWLNRTVPCLLHKYRVPGAAVAVVREGAVGFQRGWGVRRAGEEAPVTADTVFEAASLSKPVFAYGVLLLVREDRLELDRSLTDYVSPPYVPDEPRLRKITARMVLSHTTGFPNWLRNRKPDDPVLAFEPSSRFRYSGEGYSYLQRAVERITAKPMHRYIQGAVLRPLRMPRSSFVWNEGFESDFAWPHTAWGNPRFKDRPAIPRAGATLHTTAADYGRFLAAMLSTDNRSQGEMSLLSAAEVDAMLRLQVRVGRNLGWSLGWGLEEGKDDTVFWQWGDNITYKAFAAGSRRRGVGVVVFTNGKNGLQVCQAVVEAVLNLKLNAFDIGIMDD